MAKTYDLLDHDLEVLRHGGAEAIELFIEMAHKFYRTGGNTYLDCWVTAACPALPEKERHVAVAMLLRSFFGDSEMEAVVHEEHKKRQ
jgi:hypothetical protein